MGRTRYAIIALTAFMFSGVAHGDPNCAGTEAWPTSMTYVYLKNHGLVINNRIDTTRTKAVRIASEKIARNLYRQVFLVTFFRKNGAMIKSITVSDASREECSMSNVTVYPVMGPLR